MQGRWAPPSVSAEDEERIETDEDLGIGVDDDPMATLLANPAFAAAVDAAVARRIAGVQGAAEPVGQLDASAMAVLAKSIEKIATVHASQQPGYAKPLSAEEIHSRESGFAEMTALIEKAKADKAPPNYELVGEPLFAGEYLFPPGSKIRGFLIPNEHMVPLDDRARAIHRAFMQWIGGSTQGIAERVYDAERARNGTLVDPSPFHAPTSADQMPVEMVEPPQDTRAFDPRRPPQTAHEHAMSQVVHTVG
jgi:hypothetical protein